MLTVLPEIHFLPPLPSLGQPEVDSTALHPLPALCKDSLGLVNYIHAPYLVMVFSIHILKL